jgi:hypothetical protein
MVGWRSLQEFLLCRAMHDNAVKKSLAAGAKAFGSM